jgi:hypothetical protein
VWGLEADLNRMTAVGGIFPDGRNKTILSLTVHQALRYLEVDGPNATEAELAEKLAELEPLAGLAEADDE